MSSMVFPFVIIVVKIVVKEDERQKSMRAADGVRFAVFIEETTT